MPDPFFVSSKSRKRKRPEPKPRTSASGNQKNVFRANVAKKHSLGKAKGGQQKKKKLEDEELSDKTDEEEGGGIDDMDLRVDLDADPGTSGDEDEDESPAEKRLRLAKLYLESVKEDLADGEFDAAEIDKELISARLKQDVLEHSGKVHLFVADSFDFEAPHKACLRTRGHRFSVTSAVASESSHHLFTSGKEGSIIKWDLSSGKRIANFYKVKPTQSDVKGKGKAVASAEIKGHTDEVLALALSHDGKLLASAGRDRRLCVWDAEKGEWIKAFFGPMCHKDIISALSFRKGTNQLYTGSFDRTLKVYDLSAGVMGYVETLFGHQDHVLGLDSLRGETCVSVGGRDKTVRFWKIVEETQLVFRGGGRSRIREVLEGGLKADEQEGDVDLDEENVLSKAKSNEREGKKFVEGSLECVAMIDESTFLSGGDSGSISLWNTQKKKPIFTQALAHGFNELLSSTEGLIQTPRWVTALASLRYSDLFASGSWEGQIRMWKLDSKLKSFSLVGTLAAPGVINSLQLISTPETSLKNYTWIRDTDPDSTDVDRRTSTSKIGVNSVLVVAGLGQEHRLGRWLSVKEGGAVNGALVVALHPRTLV